MDNIINYKKEYMKLRQQLVSAAEGRLPENTDFLLGKKQVMLMLNIKPNKLKQLMERAENPIPYGHDETMGDFFHLNSVEKWINGMTEVKVMANGHTRRIFRD